MFRVTELRQWSPMNPVRRALPFLLTVVLLVACGTAGPDEERAVAPAPTAPASVTDSPPEEVTTSSEPPEVSTSEPVETSTSQAEPTTSAPAPEVRPLVLRPDGLGLVVLGGEAESSITQLTNQLGVPNEDSGWVASSTSPFGLCPGAQVRGVSWGPLRVMFTDPGDGAPATSFSYLYAAPADAAASSSPAAGLTTDTGIGLGSSVAEVRAAYPELLLFEDEYGPVFATSAEGGLSGTLTDVSDAGLVTSIIGGQYCGE